MTESERAAVADRLLRAIEDAADALRDWEPVEGATTFDEVLAARSSATLPGYAAFADATRLAAQLGHPSETVRQNVLWTLLDLVGRGEAERRIARAVEEGALDPTATTLLADQPDPVLLWAYIPDLGDLYRREGSATPR